MKVKETGTQRTTKKRIIIVIYLGWNVALYDEETWTSQSGDKKARSTRKWGYTHMECGLGLRESWDRKSNKLCSSAKCGSKALSDVTQS